MDDLLVKAPNATTKRQRFHLRCVRNIETGLALFYIYQRDYGTCRNGCGRHLRLTGH